MLLPRQCHGMNDALCMVFEARGKMETSTHTVDTRSVHFYIFISNKNTSLQLLN